MRGFTGPTGGRPARGQWHHGPDCHDDHGWHHHDYDSHHRGDRAWYHGDDGDQRRGPGSRRHGVQAQLLIELGVGVVPGAWITAAGRCSCEDARCGHPGTHPRDNRWPIEASTDPAVVARWWAETPDAALVVPLTNAFHVIDAPAEAGALALRWLAAVDQPVPPVAVLPAGRYQFWVPPSARVLTCPLFRSGRRRSTRDGWSQPLRLLGPGRYVLAPVSAQGRFRWERPPTVPVPALPAPEPLLEALTVTTTVWTGDMVRELSSSRWM
jgi:Bifunctional DNA primase/polymerase, N-terminal